MSNLSLLEPQNEEIIPFCWKPMPVVAGMSPLKMQTTKKQINSNSKKEQRLID